MESVMFYKFLFKNYFKYLFSKRETIHWKKVHVDCPSIEDFKKEYKYVEKYCIRCLERVLIKFKEESIEMLDPFIYPPTDPIKRKTISKIMI